MKQIVDKIPTELQYVERSVLMKELKTQNLWTFELGTQEQIYIPICIIVGFQQKEGQDSQNLAIDSFYRPPVASCHCNIGTEKYPDNAILLNYNIDDCSQGYGQIKEALKVLTKDDILQPYLSEDYFRSSNDGDNFGYNLYVFQISYQKIFENAQPIKVEFKFSENVPAGTYDYALVYCKH